MIKFNDIAEIEREREKELFLTDYPIEDSISYYWESIENMLDEMAYFEDRQDLGYRHKFTQDQKERIQDYLINNAADLLSIGYGYYSVRGYFPLTSSEEIEIDLSQYFKHAKITDYRAGIINRYSDVYISGKYAYITTSFHLDIKLDLDAIYSELAELGEA